MVNEPRRIKIAPESELARLLTEAGDMPLLLEKNGEVYRLEPLARNREDIFAGYDPEKVKKAIAATAGSWKDLDTDKLIADIYRARKEGSRPPGDRNGLYS
ncbi:MAG TPA: hypothetical protein VFA32_10290 [Dehalococcoidia bacterium]|jgi:hypothetical protein|nr:hypothetical protein [Dehalococcoidia bacterium]